jgi:hypothetical protein
MKSRPWVQVLVVPGVDRECSRLVSMLCVVMRDVVVVWGFSWIGWCDDGGVLW